MTDWKELGHQLGISPIKTSLLCGDTEHCREKVVQEWLKEGKTASWEKLCTALEQMGREEEVQAIKERYLVTSKHAPEPKGIQSFEGCTSCFVFKLLLLPYV